MNELELDKQGNFINQEEVKKYLENVNNVKRSPSIIAVGQTNIDK